MRDAVGNVSPSLTVTAHPRAADPDDDLPLGIDAPSPSDDLIDPAGPIDPDLAHDIQDYLEDDGSESGSAVGWLAEAAAGNVAPSAAYPPEGPNELPFTCRGSWAPVQAVASGFVIGNCKGGTAVLGLYTTLFARPPGGASEGRAWEAGSINSYKDLNGDELNISRGCGWINVRKRLVEGSYLPPNNCRGQSFSVANKDDYIKRYKGTRVGSSGSVPPFSRKYGGFYIWASYVQVSGGYGEIDGKRYIPRFDDSTKVCYAYANINPYSSNQRVTATQRMWAVHDNSRHLYIRYVAKHRVRTEGGGLDWFVMARSRDDSDRDQPWGFVPATCLFTR